MAFALTSPAFADGSAIPGKYTADGDDISPPLQWSDPPAEVRSFALICEDPDAPSGTFRHWLLANIPAAANSLGESQRPSDGMTQARNDFGHASYGGPAPPRGHGVHHYHFRLLALDTDRLELSAAHDAGQFRQQVTPHVIDEAQLVGTYER
jgi:Raf kinase inhibitor-like YbhB/YbcL family protein